MKILHCVGSFVNGGVETLLVNLVNQQIKENDVTIIIVTSMWTNELLNLLNPKVNVKFINKPIGSQNPWYFLKLLYYYKFYNPDILHLHGPASARFFPFKSKKEKRFVTLHNEVMKMPYNETVDTYIAISKCVMDAFIRNTGHHNCVVCYNGVDFSKIKVKQEFSSKPVKILCIARVLFVTKAQDIVVEAISLLPQDLRNSIHLDFWGDGPDLDVLKKLISKYNLENSITVCGNKPNDYVNEHLCDYDIIIQASHHEGLGLCAIEAMGSKTPVILSRALGFMEVSEEGTYSNMFDCGDAKSLADVIVSVCNKYSAACNMASSAYEHVRTRFSITEYTSQISDIYKN